MTGMWIGGPGNNSFLVRKTDPFDVPAIVSLSLFVCANVIVGQIEMAMPAIQHLNYGAPATLWLNVTVLSDFNSVSLDLQMFNKLEYIYITNAHNAH